MAVKLEKGGCLAPRCTLTAWPCQKMDASLSSKKWEAEEAKWSEMGIQFNLYIYIYIILPQKHGVLSYWDSCHARDDQICGLMGNYRQSILFWLRSHDGVWFEHVWTMKSERHGLGTIRVKVRPCLALLQKVMSKTTEAICHPIPNGMLVGPEGYATNANTGLITPRRSELYLVGQFLKPPLIISNSEP